MARYIYEWDFDQRDRDFILAHSNLSEAQLERLNDLVSKITGNELDVKYELKRLWHETTDLSKKGKKQQDWHDYGSDQIIENWALNVHEDVYFHFEEDARFLNMSNEELLEYQAAVDEIDDILGEILY